MKRAAPSEEHDRDQVFSLLTPHLDRLREFLRDQIAYFESAGELVPGELTTQEVLDAVLLRAARARPGPQGAGHRQLADSTGERAAAG
jgi:hypothetical protein